MPIQKPSEISVTPIDPSQILTLSEVAERLKVSERWVYEKTRNRCPRPLPAIRIGRYLRFDWSAVSSWLRGHSSNSAQYHPIQGPSTTMGAARPKRTPVAMQALEGSL